LDQAQLRLAVASFEAHLSAAKIADVLRSSGASGLEAATAELGGQTRARVEDTVALLQDKGIRALFLTDDAYPKALTELEAPPPILFFLGNLELLGGSAVGMCGSRSASAAGLEAARSCGLAVASQGLTIVSGYAAGVDTETHLAALDAGGSTIMVLAEGFKYFRVKRVFGDLDMSRVLVLSQFAPRQTWNVGAAMTRNAVIAALGRALVVVEAGETGGTLNAGLQALAFGRPVLALEFETGPTPAGNRRLIDEGAIAITTPGDLKKAVTALGNPSGRALDQLSLALA
jgi:DNA processing protein